MSAEDKRRIGPAGPGETRGPDPGREVPVIDRRAPGLRREAGDPDAPPSVAGADPSGAGEAPGGAVPGTPRYPTFVEELIAQKTAAEQRLEEVVAAHRRVVAEQDAFRARLTRDVQRRVDGQLGETLAALLEVLDDLERAIAHAEAAPETGASVSRLLEGVRLIRNRFLAVLASSGVERFETAGRPFDPACAEAVQVVEVAQADRDGLVLEDLRAGYRLGERILRPARVTVGRIAADSGEPAVSGGPEGPPKE